MRCLNSKGEKIAWRQGGTPSNPTPLSTPLYASFRLVCLSVDKQRITLASHPGRATTGLR